MAKIIFTSQYMKGELPAHLKHYVRYIATREGVEKLDESKKLLPATEKQRRLIQKLLKDFPDAKQLLEYEDYRRQGTRENASDFISQVIDRYVALTEKRENYVDYIGTRPGVDISGRHGLFTDAGEPVILNAVQKEVADHEGVIWTHVVSLRREDAIRLGYDEGKAWQALLRSKRAMFCREMKIDSQNLRWYAAFHNGSHHPHCHIMIYSEKETEGYLSKKAIQNMRAELAHDIFRQEFLQIYTEQKVSRKRLLQETEAVLQSLKELEAPMLSRAFQENFVHLAEKLSRTKGKKVYGYLKADVKQLVDRLTDELAEAPEIREAYRVWRRWQDAVSEFYGESEQKNQPKLSQEQKLKVIKNKIIQSAAALLSLPDAQLLSLEQEEPIQASHTAVQKKGYQQYLLGKQCWQTRRDAGDRKQAIEHLEQAWKNGNFYAGLLLGRIYSDRREGFFCYKRAVELLLPLAEEGNPTAQYCLGRLYWQERQKDGQEVQAKYWLKQSADNGNPYAEAFLEAIQTSFETQVLTAGGKLLQDMARLFQQELGQSYDKALYGIDRKRRRKLWQKQIAHGQKEEDGMESQTM